MDAHAKAAWSLLRWALCRGVIIIDNISAGNGTQSGYEEHPEALKDAVIILHTASTELQAICRRYGGQKRFRYQVRNERKEGKNWPKEKPADTSLSAMGQLLKMHLSDIVCF